MYPGWRSSRGLRLTASTRCGHCPCQRRAGLLQHPLADVLDQSGFLGQRDELIRRDLATLEVYPAQQHLGAGRRALSSISRTNAPVANSQPPGERLMLRLAEPATRMQQRRTERQPGCRQGSILVVLLNQIARPPCVHCPETPSGKECPASRTLPRHSAATPRRPRTAAVQARIERLAP